MRETGVGLALALAGVLMAAGGAEAQGRIPLAVEVRGGFAQPTGNWNDDDQLEGGVGFGADVQLIVAPGFALYGGWERHLFPVKGSGDAEAIDQGFRAGALVWLPTPEIIPVLMLGLVFNETSLEVDTDATTTFESDAGVGLEGGVGAEVPLGTVLRFTPMLRYTTHRAEFPAFAGFADEDLTVAHVKLDLGLKLNF